jgi:hypothetical protein
MFELLMFLLLQATEETLVKVQGIIAGQLACEIGKVLPEAKFADLGADSLDTVSCTICPSTSLSFLDLHYVRSPK